MKCLLLLRYFLEEQRYGWGKAQNGQVKAMLKRFFRHFNAIKVALVDTIDILSRLLRWINEILEAPSRFAYGSENIWREVGNCHSIVWFQPIL